VDPADDSGPAALSFHVAPPVASSFDALVPALSASSLSSSGILHCKSAHLNFQPGSAGKRITRFKASLSCYTGTMHALNRLCLYAGLDDESKGLYIRTKHHTVLVRIKWLAFSPAMLVMQLVGGKISPHKF
jgi:hypothetical protein